MAIAKWYKVDFHTHTPESRCFPDKEVTADIWIEKAKSSGLNAVVVCDHNSVGFINEIEKVRKNYEDKEFKVFYGIELCVSADFTHILIIFDDKMSVTEIEDAVIGCLGLKRDKWTDTEVNVSEDKLKDLCREYHDRIFIIPAHFASNKGLGKCNINAIKKYKEFIEFSAIEVRNEEDVREYHNKLDLGVINKAVLITGSDNPSSKDESQHAIEGFGKMFTWVKMSEISFDGLRQVFLDPEHRCINWVDLVSIGEEFNPNQITYNYISGTILKGFSHMTEMNMRFSPNLNCIVGGRGTGKSTIVDALDYGVGDKTDITKCPLIDKTLDSESGKITTFFNFGIDKQYKIDTTRNKKVFNQSVEDENGVVETPPQFKVDFYGQKQIFDLLEEDDNVSSGISPLVKMIDSKISLELYKYNDDMDKYILELSRLSDEYKSNRKRIKELPTVKAEIDKAEAILSKFKASGLEDARKDFEQTDRVIKNVEKLLRENQNSVTLHADNIQFKIEELAEQIVDIDDGSDSIKESLEVLSRMSDVLRKTHDELIKSVQEIEKIKENYKTTDIYTRREEQREKYQEALIELKNTGGENIEEIQDKLQKNRERKTELIEINKQQEKLVEEIRSNICMFIESRKELSKKRKDVVEKLELENIAIEIEPLGHKARWKQNLQKELGRNGTFDNDFEALTDIVLNKENNYASYADFLFYLLTSESGDITEVYPESTNGRFNKMWNDKQANDTLSSLIKVIPEDKIAIKIVDANGSMDINEGSPGQKSAAILAFILNSGTDPLIIDQPEDDLDNSLIYNLVVKSIRKMKDKRQIIVVTHNPNIPVLGDAEGILILERDNNGKVTFRKQKKAGCIEEKLIREGICDIMEGGEEAFKKREKKYQY